MRGRLPGGIVVPLSDAHPETVHARHLLPTRLGIGHVLSAGDSWLLHKPHVAGGMCDLPAGSFLRRRLGKQLRTIDLQPTGRPVLANGVQAVPTKRCDERDRRYFCQRLRLRPGILQLPVNERASPMRKVPSGFEVHQ